MVDVRGDVLWPPHCTTPAAVKSNKKSEMRPFKKEGESYKSLSSGMVVVAQIWRSDGQG